MTGAGISLLAIFWITPSQSFSAVRYGWCMLNIIFVYNSHDRYAGSPVSTALFTAAAFCLFVMFVLFCALR